MIIIIIIVKEKMKLYKKFQNAIIKVNEMENKLDDNGKKKKKEKKLMQ